MLILTFEPIVKWAERIDRCTVRGARITHSPLKQFTSTLRRRWKLHLFEPGMDLSRTESRRDQPTKQRRCKSPHHGLKNSESS
ncbi:MAG: hypothetical protein DMF37_01280 [Verrucomicrobia bacterium]|nr:MAG: hypothetical protein DMF37_01280 [Verrucomicrobiota bacterium]